MSTSRVSHFHYRTEYVEYRCRVFVIAYLQNHGRWRVVCLWQMSVSSEGATYSDHGGAARQTELMTPDSQTHVISSTNQYALPTHAVKQVPAQFVDQRNSPLRLRSSLWPFFLRFARGEELTRGVRPRCVVQTTKGHSPTIWS